MIDRYFNGRLIGLVDFEDVVVEQRAIEFTDPAIPVRGSHLAVIVPDDGLWPAAKVQISPDVAEVSVEFVLWAIEKARELVQRDSSGG
ncbi:hypothetical protein [Nocardia sp. NPDC058497]|uniref:hypothetical protein n=1 Tax=Nocardia sp. NPDC058497 TaxID=3346529 RepID=UPI003649982D